MYNGENSNKAAISEGQPRLQEMMSTFSMQLDSLEKSTGRLSTISRKLHHQPEPEDCDKLNKPVPSDCFTGHLQSAIDRLDRLNSVIYNTLNQLDRVV
jgi:hypothetical protein